ncbi:MAG: radical SAM protein [Candidatus Nanoarchaeia archaeon]|nr:radical SAM protein [Candidatus Nanoarchaeia archaeon]MDD5588081.1 radical SAM protein [Candidatus Nanoarchaeia archaeon]
MIDSLISGFLVLTYDCNNRCKWCYASPSGFKKRLMDFKKIENYLKLMKSLGIKSLGLLGGEPTLYPNLFEVIKLAKRYDFKVTLYTNGRKLSNEDFVKKLKKAGLDFINFSVQSGSNYAEKHNKTVNFNGAWAETKKGIENAYKSGLKINIQTVLTHSDINIYKELIDEFSYANLFIYYRQIPAVTSNCKFFDKKVFPNRETKEIYKKIYVYAKDKGVRSYFFSRMPLCWWDDKDLLEKEIHKNIVSHCHIINGSILAIDVNGKILPCPQYINLHSINLIKNNKLISKKEFIKSYNKGLPNEIREKLKYVPDKKCLNCEYFGKRCTGGCPLIKFEIGPYAPFSK